MTERAPMPGPHADAWAFARALSPRSRVRVADVDPSSGRPVNAYSSELALAGPSPGRPFAVYLSDGRGRFRLLGFDLDAGKGPVAADLDRLRGLLGRARLAHVVCASGPSGGRHVWVALAEPVPGAVVARLARGLARMLPSLDVAPLLNSRTGALRPPGAPHRLSGASRVLAGSPAALLAPAGTAAAVLRLAGLVEQYAPTVEAPRAAAHVVGRDGAGRPYLPGERRALPAAARAALEDPLAPGADASAVLARVLTGAAWARWRFEDLAALLDTGPGLEHARSERAGASRVPRSRGQALRVLLRQWDRACRHVAAAPRSAGAAAGDVEWPQRVRGVVDAVARVQARAEAAPGRWARPGGPADRRVLDEMCAQALAAVRTAVELDVRRLGMRCGISRETARVALLRLAADGWASQAGLAEGVHAARWNLPDLPASLSTVGVSKDLSQADPRASAAWPRLLAWRSHLAHRRASVSHDTFTPTGLGHHTARIYQCLAGQPTGARDLATRLGYALPRAARYLDRLASSGLARTDRRGRWRRGPGVLDRVADRLGVTGVLRERAVRYALEREAWAWWCDELAWRRLPRAAKRREPAPGQIVLDLGHLAGLTIRRRRGAHPRRPDGRADYGRALARLRQEAHEVGEALSAVA